MTVQSLTDLYNTLNAAVVPPSSGVAAYLEFNTALLPAAGVLAAYLDANGNPLRVSANAKDTLVVLGQTQVTVTGISSLFAGQVGYAVTVIGTVSNPGPDAVVSFAFAAAPSDIGGWSFTANFPNLPGYDGYNYATRTLGPIATSYFEELAITPPATGTPLLTCATGPTAQPLTLDALLDARAGTLAPHLGNYLVPQAAPPLHLQGFIVPQSGDGPPEVQLSAPVPGLSIGVLTGIALGLSVTPADGVTAATSDLQFQAGIPAPIAGQSPVAGPALAGDFLWNFSASFPQGTLPLGSAVDALETFFGAPPLLPTGFGDALIGGFSLTSVSAGFAPSDLSRLVYVGARIDSGKLGWTVPITGIELSRIVIGWESYANASGQLGEISGSVTAVIDLGASVLLDVKITLGEGYDGDEIEISLAPGSVVALDAVVQRFTGIDTLALPGNPTITQFDMRAAIAARTYMFFAAVTLEEDMFARVHDAMATATLTLAVNYQPGSWTIAIAATVTLGRLTFSAEAEYLGAGAGWLFQGGLTPWGSAGTPVRSGVTIGDFFDLLGFESTLLDSISTITLTGIDASFDTTNGAFEFGIDVDWSYTLEGYSLLGEAQFQLNGSKTPTGQTVYSGAVTGQLQINALSLAVIYDFGIIGSSVAFAISYRGVTLTAVESLDPTTGHKILAVNLGGVNFGEIVDFLVDLADPGANFRLSSPWDVLYQLSFDALTLTIDLITRAVGVTYAANVDLGFVNIGTLSLTYVDQAGVSGVQFAMTGSFGDQDYTGGNELSWDLLNDPPPTPAGKGPSALDLRFVGLGQNVGFSQPGSYGTVQDVIAAMTSAFPPAGATGPSPLAIGNDALAFTGNGCWLIGADFTLASAVEIQVVFNDPVLYGLRVALSGEKVKSLAGLDFEILYKKVTDTIGVYHIDLTLPTAMRQLQFGAVSLTLPPVAIDIYTNGDFYIDCGFPVGLDYSNSACVQAAVFTGYGGFYFGVLDGATSNQVPQISNGSFAPVIEFGVALSIGLGRSFNEGVLKAGLTISVAGSLQGVFAWFEPTDHSQPSGMYYRVIGTASLRGHLYGEADFIIISARVDVLAYAQLTLAIESHAPIEVEVELRVEVSASIKVLFVTIHFHYSMGFDFSFKIGSSSSTPWVVTSQPPAPLSLPQQTRAHWRQRSSGAALYRRLIAGLDAANGSNEASFNWTPTRFFVEPRPLPLVLSAALTVGATGASAPAVQTVLSLYAGNSVPPWITQGRQAAIVEMDDPEEAAFNIIAATMLRWSLEAYQRPPGLGDTSPSSYTLASDLEAILAYLGDSDNWRAVFSYDALADFMRLNFRYQISTPQGPGATAPSGLTGPPPSVAVFPMIPELGIVDPTGTTSWFKDQALIGADYEDALQAYYAQLKPPAATGPSGPAALATAETDQSLSAFVFRDYFAMVAKGAANSARSMLKAYPYRTTGLSGPTGMGESLASIAAGFTGPPLAYDVGGWESLAHVSGRLGVSIADLRRANPALAGFGDRAALPAGTVVIVPTGATPATIADANSDYPLQPGPSGGPSVVPLDGVLHQIRAATGPTGQSEALITIRLDYGLADSSALFEGPVGQVNGSNAGLLRPGTQWSTNQASWGAASGLNIADPESIAGLFVARSVTGPQPADGLWYDLVNRYAQFIRAHNTSLTGATWSVPLMGWTGPTGPSAPNGSNAMVLGATGYLVQGLTGPIGVTLPGPSRDTVESASAALVLRQLQPAPYGDQYLQFLDMMNVAPGVVTTPPLACVVRPGDTLAGLAARFGTDAPTVAEVNDLMPGLLQPLAVLALPTLSYAVQPNDTIGSIGAAYDLSIDQMAESLAQVTGLFETWGITDQTLTIPNLPGRNTADLIADLAGFGEFNQVSGMVSRFLLHGMRVPVASTGPIGSFPPDVPLYPLWQQAGQQFVVPTGPTGMMIELASDAVWADFESGTPTGPTARLQVELTADFIAAYSPAPVLGITFLVGPTAIPLWADAPPHYPFEQPVHWQAAVPVGLPGGSGPVAGQPSIWSLPSTLQAIASASATGPIGAGWGLYAAPASQPMATPVRIDRMSWGSAVDLTIKRVRDAAGSAVANAYLLIGADQDGRDRLLDLWPVLGGEGEGDQIFLLYAPNATGGNAQGLASQSLDVSNTAILLAGLSTVTHGAGLEMAAADGDFYATAASPRDFVRLAWEASITGQGGFYLLYRQVGGGDLPDTLFAGGGDETVLRMVVLTAAQAQDGATALTASNNVAVVGENIAGHTRVFAQLDDPQPSDLVRSAVAAPGLAGFYLVRANPEAEGTSPLSPADQTRALHQLVGVRVAANADFVESNAAMPSGPLDGDTTPVQGPTGPGLWRYRTLLPVYRFGIANSTPNSAALPPAAENPYRGIRGPDATGAIAQAILPLDFYDVFGNETTFDGPKPVVEVPIGYTDALIGPGAWPGAANAYAFRAAGSGGIALETVLSLQPGRYAPQGSYDFAQSSGAATADVGRYSSAFYQAQQPDLNFTLSTNLGAVDLEPAVLKVSMTAFVTKSLVYASAAATQQQRTGTTTAGQTLADFAQIWRTDAASLVRENQDEPLLALFAGAVVLPTIAVAAPSLSLSTLAAKGAVPPGATAFPPSCAAGLELRRRGAGLRVAVAADVDGKNASPPASDPITALDVASWNLSAPLAAGLLLSVPSATFVLPAAASLDQVAARTGGTVYATIPGANGDVPVGIYVDNFTAAIVATGIPITIQGISLPSGGSLSALFDSFVAKLPNLLDTDFVAAIRGVAGLIVAGPVVSTTFIVPSAKPYMLANLTSVALAAVVAANQWTPGFYKPGTPLYLGYACVTPSDTDTFASLAAEKNIPIEALATYNGGALNGGIELSIPGLTYIDSEAVAYASYSPRADDSLAAVATAFGLAADGYRTTGLLTAELPGIFADGVVVPGIGSGAGATAQAGDSLASMAGKLNLPVDGFLDHVADLTGLYRQSAAFLGPIPHVPGLSYSPAIDALANQLNLAGPNGLSGTAMLLDANRALDGFLNPGATWQGPAGMTAIAVKPHDTVATLLGAIQAATTGPFGVAELAAANLGKTGLLNPGATFLVPPDPTLISAPMVPQIPPAGCIGASAIAFPVSVSIATTRAWSWLDPNFQGAIDVFQTIAGIGPEGISGPGGTVDLKAFAASFEQAFAAEQLRCAVTEDKAVDAAARIWALNLGPSGANGIAVGVADPAFYALAPLSTALMSGTVDFPVYQSGTGFGAIATRTFNSIDLDAWMLSFLSAVDLMLTPQYAAAAFAVGGAPAGLASGPRGLADLGRAAFDTIVNAKQQLAYGLTGQVMPVLTGVGATQGPPIETARETMLQQMLSKLSDAYSIASVVQFPVDLVSPCDGTGGYAPRLSGRVVPDLYTVRGTTAGTLATAAVWFGVAAPALVQAIAGARGLLQAGTVVVWPPEAALSYKIGASDSLGDVAHGLGLPLLSWQDFTAFATGLLDQPIFAAGGAIPAIRIQRQIQPGETGPALAAFFQTDVGGLFEANQTRAGILPDRTSITIGGKTYQVGDGETLVSIMAANGWTLQDLADWAVGTASDPPPPLAAGVVLGFVRLLPDIELSSAKLSLAQGDPPPQLSFTVSVKRPESVRNLFLNLRFVVTELEYAISDVAAAPGYQASSWLSLVDPLGKTGAGFAMPQTQIPIPLRFYPTPGSLLSQQSSAVPLPPGLDSAQAITDGRQWDYSFDLATDTAEQDTIHLDMLFNSDGTDPDSGGGIAATGSLFPALAQFIDSWPALSADLERLLVDPMGAEDPTAAIAVQVFAVLCDQVANALWLDLSADALEIAGPTVRYRYSMSIENQGSDLGTLTLASEAGIAQDVWPTIAVQGPTAFQPLDGPAGQGASRIYNYPPGLTATPPIIHRFDFSGRDCLESQNGWAGVSISRNDDLVASGPVGYTPTGPTGATGPMSVAPEFIYQTPTVRFVNPLAPFIDRPDPIDVAGLTMPHAAPPMRSITQHLQNMFDAVLMGPTGSGVWLSARCDYGRPLTPLGPTAMMPVLFMPTTAAANTDVLAGQLGSSLRDWWQTTMPGPIGALTIDLTVYAQPVGASGQKALLEFEALTLPLDEIDWSGS